MMMVVVLLLVCLRHNLARHLCCIGVPAICPHNQVVLLLLAIVVQCVMLAIV